jgi:cardiolipin synthase
VTVPNVLTLLRLAAVPVFAILWLKGMLVAALWVFLGAAITDVLDGLLARLLHQQTPLGALLDPIADKLMLVVAWIVAACTGVASTGIAAVVIGRDILLAGGAFFFGVLWKGRHAPAEWRPTRLGKYAVFMQALTIALAILDAAIQPPGVGELIPPLMVMAACLSLLSIAQYSARAVRAVTHKAAVEARS